MVYSRAVIFQMQPQPQISIDEIYFDRETPETKTNLNDQEIQVTWAIKFKMSFFASEEVFCYGDNVFYLSN
jgi:hypothetical protein